MHIIFIILLVLLIFGVIGTLISKDYKAKPDGRETRRTVLIGESVMATVLIFLIAATGSKPSVSTPPSTATPAKSAAVNATPAASQLHLIGIGETEEVWAKTHTADTSLAKDRAYNNNPKDIFGDPANPKNNDKYVTVTRQNGVIDSYFMQLKKPMSYEQAKKVALAEVPSDEVTVWEATAKDNACKQLQVKSDFMLAQLQKYEPSDNGGIIFEFSSVKGQNQDYDPASITAILVTLGFYSAAESAPSCFV